MSIAIIRAGRVGGTLGCRWAQAGHTVIFGTRDPASEKVQAGCARRALTPARLQGPNIAFKLLRQPAQA